MADILEKVEYIAKLSLMIGLSASLAIFAGILMEMIVPIGPLLKDFGITEIVGFSIIDMTWAHLYVPFAIFLAVVHWFLSMRRDLSENVESEAPPT